VFEFINFPLNNVFYIQYFNILFNYYFPNSLLLHYWLILDPSDYWEEFIFLRGLIFCLCIYSCHGLYSILPISSFIEYFCLLFYWSFPSIYNIKKCKCFMHSCKGQRQEFVLFSQKYLIYSISSNYRFIYYLAFLGPGKPLSFSFSYCKMLLSLPQLLFFHHIFKN
jgi:hypothetical protein